MIDDILERFNDDDAQAEFGADPQKYMIVGIVPYILPILFFLPIIFDSKSAYCKFHANQQFAWLVIMLAAGVIAMILGVFPLIGWLMEAIVVIAILAVMALLAYGAYKGYALKLPIIGDIITLFR